MHTARCFTTVLLLTLAPASRVYSEEKLPGARFRSDSDVVLVPTTVLSRRGAIVTGLSREDFQVTQDNVPQQIISFGEDDVPVSIGVVLDTSGSMVPVLREAKNTLRTFFEAANREDEAFLFTVSNRPNRDSGFTENFETLLGQAMFTQAGGSTALTDAIYAAIGQMRTARHGRRAILVISDGMDNHSRYSKSELMAAAVEADLEIYSISVFDPPRNKKPIELKEEHDGIFFLSELTRRTGGVQIVIRDSAEARQAAERIARVMRHQYIIGYVPDHSRPAHSDDSGKWHSIKVLLHAPDARAYARSGYYSK